MALQIPDEGNLKKYTKASIYLKEHPAHKICIAGGIVSAYADERTVTIKTNTNDASFNAEDVIAIVFE